MTRRDRVIYKICPAELWREAESAGVFRGAPVDTQDGFIHFSHIFPDPSSPKPLPNAPKLQS